MNRQYGDPANNWGNPSPDKPRQGKLEPKGTTDLPAKAVKDEGTPEPVWRPYQEPDSPLRPHRFRPQSQLLSKSPKVLITPQAYKLMCLYVEIAPKEVGWHGTVTRTKDGDFLIEETFLLEQEVTGTETELGTAGREKLVLDFLKLGDPGLEKANQLRFWGHSHVRMGTSPSPTDESTMRQFGKEGMPWYVRGIFTKTGRGEFTIYLFDQGLRIIDAPWAVWDPDEGIILEGSSHERSFGSYMYGQDFDHCGAYRYRTDPQGLSSKPLPAKLIPDHHLRAAVKAEHEAKVRERLPTFWSWLSSDEDDNGMAADFECIPTGLDTQSPRTDQTSKGFSQRTVLHHDSFPYEHPKSRGFFGWLYDVLLGPTPDTKPKPAGPRGGQTQTPDRSRQSSPTTKAADLKNPVGNAGVSLEQDDQRKPAEQ